MDKCIIFCVFDEELWTHLHKPHIQPVCEVTIGLQIEHIQHGKGIFLFEETFDEHSFRGVVLQLLVAILITMLEMTNMKHSNQI